MIKSWIACLVLLFIIGTNLRAQDRYEESLGLPGDNLNLYAVMKLFQESETLEGFERSLNDEKSTINNLDLDADNRIDYIRVLDNTEGNFHIIVLQVAVSPRENQDVAVFTVQRDSEGRVQIQLTGDEALYGKDYIIEPNFDDLESGAYGQTPNPGYTGNTRVVRGETVVINRTTTVEIATWPLVRFMFLPSYVIWHSPWYYGYYPPYWRPWRPYYWHYYYGYHNNWDPYYYGHYRRWHVHRDPYWNNSYYGQRRSYSPQVYTRIQGGSYKSTYSRPDTRREGSKQYYRNNPDQRSRRAANSRRDPSINRSYEKSGSGRQSVGTGSTGRSAETGTTRRSTSTQTERRTTTPKEGTTTRRAGTRQQQTGTQTNRKSSGTGVSNSGRRASETKKSGTTKESTGKSRERRRTN